LADVSGSFKTVLDLRTLTIPAVLDLSAFFLEKVGAGLVPLWVLNSEIQSPVPRTADWGRWYLSFFK
jgi:hypothetical protein